MGKNGDLLGTGSDESAVYVGRLLTSSDDASGYAQYRKTNTAGFFVHVPIEDADIFRIVLFPNTDYLYSIEIEIEGEFWRLTRGDDNNSGASQGYYYFVPPIASNNDVVWFELQGADTLESFQILDEDTFNIAGNEFFAPSYWTTFDKVKNPITFGVEMVQVTHNGIPVTNNGIPVTHRRNRL